MKNSNLVRVFQTYGIQIVNTPFVCLKFIAYLLNCIFSRNN